MNHGFKMKSILLVGTLLFCIGDMAQSPHTNFSLATGVMKVLNTDEAISPYVLKDISGLFRVAASRQKILSEHNLQFSFGSLTLKSDNPDMYNVPSQFYFLQYAFQRQILTKKRTLLWVGPALSTYAFIRQANYTTTGEFIGSLEFRIQALRALSKMSNAGVGINLPVVSSLVHRNYGLSEFDSEIVSWGKFRSFQLQFIYLLTLSNHFDFILGYDLLYYNYKFEETVITTNQQFYCGLRINIK